MWELIPKGAIYCINLKRRKDRKRLSQREFERIGLGDSHNHSHNHHHPVTFFPAIESGPLQGCFESHQAVVRLARARQQKIVVIFEDDVYFSATATAATATWQRYGEAVREYLLPEGTPWEILFLGHMPLWTSPNPTTHIYQTRSLLAHAYVLRTDSKLADELVQREYREGWPIDWYYFRFAKALAVYPMVAFQTPSESNNIPSSFSFASKWCLDFFFMNLEMWAKVMDWLWWLMRRVLGVLIFAKSHRD